MPDIVEDLKEQVIKALNLRDVTPEDIDPDAPLFGEGLELDSIDALEIVVMLEKRYGIRVEDMDVARQAFRSVNALAEFVTENRESCEQTE
ncbi:MAG: acyl carrier protein [Candidatus Brocadiaceae bacterium]|mgnify:FL=1|nr:acyl carrier protein [Candidatus Brocadiaceae bacterium]